MEGMHWSARYCSPQCKGPRKPKPSRAEREARTAELNALRAAPPPCANCQKPIPPERIPAKYCSDQCNAKAYVERNAARLDAERIAANEARAAARLVLIDCEFCGETFEKRAWNQRYCSKLCGQRGWAKENPEHYAQIQAQSEARRHAKWVDRRDNRPPCPMCGTALPRERGPKAIYCSDACNEHANYERNRGVLLLRMRDYRMRNREYFREKAIEGHARRLAADPDGYPSKLRMRALSWHRRNRELVRERARLRTLLNPGRGSIHAANYRARRAGAETFVFTERDWRRLVNRYEHCCAYCGKLIEGVVHKEHVIPLSRGGRHSVGNILPACESCNFSKGDLFVMEWRMREIRFGRDQGLAS